jgi:hypothetical protein
MKIHCETFRDVGMFYDSVTIYNFYMYIHTAEGTPGKTQTQVIGKY